MESRFMKRAAMGVAVGAVMLAGGVAQAAGITGQGTWETTLQPRDIDGDTVTDAFYDTALDITWLRNANINGATDWATAAAWAGNLAFGAYSDWRLPTVTPLNGAFFNDLPSSNGSTDQGYAKTGIGWGTANEMGHLYYVTLGNKGLCTPNDADPSLTGNCVFQDGQGLKNSGDFANFVTGYYWSNAGNSQGRSFCFGTGVQGYVDCWPVAKYAMAVRNGDVLAVPEPQTYAMLLLGLGAVLLAARRRPN